MEIVKLTAGVKILKMLKLERETVLKIQRMLHEIMPREDYKIVITLTVRQMGNMNGYGGIMHH